METGGSTIGRSLNTADNTRACYRLDLYTVAVTTIACRAKERIQLLVDTVPKQLNAISTKNT